ncbi:hypothetical protein [Candidatus Aquiluna sp. UB-MaderosW2red]|uniref:hypothetical protein n=1 Tax=Candidatus Aquiluna sp. UB-MaderosW2red TaxID=1855377 RepID=UPI000875EA8C|nr:hypothetical protein [Candidatus Aquiluna sp. UB-MaderosW2red]SCX07923.1 hypothetical protein SAMN05216534_0688 [Candidatus Aquiluna sp. UB-MaderosW2red]
MAKVLRRRIPNWAWLSAGMCIVAVALALSALNRPLPQYLVAAVDLKPGAAISISDFTLINLDLGSSANSYLGPSELIAEASVTRLIPAGELLPTRSVREFVAPGMTSIRFVPGLKPSTNVRPGTWVSIWQVVETETGFESQRIVERSEVTEVAFGEGLFAADFPEVELILSLAEATLVLGAVAADTDLFVLEQ